jgi:stage II sporulation protein D
VGQIPQPAPASAPVAPKPPSPSAIAPAQRPTIALEAGTADRLAPEPRIRVGLSAAASSVRLTSSRPFWIGADERLVETQDVLIEALASTSLEGARYRVQLGSFPARSDAAALLASLRDELDDDFVISREAGSGRFVLRLGSFTTETGARARLAGLANLGLETATVVREPTRTPRPQALVLRPVGQPAVQTSALTLFALPQESGAWIEIDSTPYRGYLELFVNNSNLFTLVNVVNLEDYLLGVVPAELSPAAFPEKEAIKAQAIAARTYAVKRRGQFAAEGYDICATPACQVYRGFSAEQLMSNEAVRETIGEVLTYQGELVDALYTSTCGGRTENSENVFTSPQPYLVSRACFLEPRGQVVRSEDAAAISLEAASLKLLGIVDGGEPRADVDEREAYQWVERAVAYLGQTPCWEANQNATSSPIDVVGLAGLLGEGLCWERRVPFLMSSEDASRIVPLERLSERQRLHLAYAIQEGWLRPDPEGITRGRALARRDVVETLYRVVSGRGEPPLRAGRLLRVEAGRLWIADETLGDDDNELSVTLAPGSYLFRRAGESTYHARELSLLPGDDVLFRVGERGLDILVLVSVGASFDRSSRLSHWSVRKSNEDLSRELRSRGAIGDVVALRPKRYGRSGRIIQLDVVGTSGAIELNGLEVRRALGIRENLFFIDEQRGAGGAVEDWVFTGRGWGHGVGMCQVGAFGMAAAGYGYRQILSHYYAGTRVERRSWTLTQGARLDVDNVSSSP